MRAVGARAGRGRSCEKTPFGLSQPGTTHACTIHTVFFMNVAVHACRTAARVTSRSGANGTAILPCRARTGCRGSSAGASGRSGPGIPAAALSAERDVHQPDDARRRAVPVVDEAARVARVDAAVGTDLAIDVRVGDVVRARARARTRRPGSCRAATRRRDRRVLQRDRARDDEIGRELGARRRVERLVGLVLGDLVGVGGRDRGRGRGGRRRRASCVLRPPSGRARSPSTVARPTTNAPTTIATTADERRRVIRRASRRRADARHGRHRHLCRGSDATPRGGARRRTPPAAPRRGRSASSASCLPSGARAACACA